jgi:hypothetical protein
MTPGMLVKLRDLRKAKRAIFVICTNYEDRIDKAAKRQGRIDESLLVLPPDWSNRIRILIQELIVNHKSLKDKYKNDYDKKELIRKFGTAISNLYTIDVKHNEKLHNEYDVLKQGTFLYGYDEIKNLAEKIMEKKQSQDSALFKICNMIKTEIEPLARRDEYVIDYNNLPGTEELFYEIFELAREKFIKSEGLHGPMISLNAYSHRFHSNEKENNEKLKTVQQPFDEFCGLCAMLALYCDDIYSEITHYLKENNELEDISKIILKNGNENANRLKEYIGQKNIEFGTDEIESLCRVLNDFSQEQQ